MNPRLLLLLPIIFLGSCSNSEKRAEEDRKNIYLAEFFNEQGFFHRSVAHAKKIKPGSPHYEAAQDWIERSSFAEEDLDYSE